MRRLMAILTLKAELPVKVVALRGASALNVVSVLNAQNDQSVVSAVNVATVTVLKLLLLPVPAQVLLQLVW
jgi:hypothetical protein